MSAFHLFIIIICVVSLRGSLGLQRMFHRFAMYFVRFVELNNKWFIIILSESIHFVILFFSSRINFSCFVFHNLREHEIRYFKRCYHWRRYFLGHTELNYFIQFDSLGNVLQYHGRLKNALNSAKFGGILNGIRLRLT